MSFTFDDCLDKDIAELPRSVPREVLPAGVYIVTLTDVTRKLISDVDSVIFKYTLAEAVEVAQPDAGVPEIGTKFEEKFNVGGDYQEMGIARLTSHICDVHTGKLGIFLREPPIGSNFKIISKCRDYVDKKSGEKRRSWETLSTKDVGGLQFVG